MAIDLELLNEEFHNTADYDLVDPPDVSKARRFIVACRRILGLSPQRLQKQSGEIELPDRRHVAERLEEAETWFKHYSRPAWNERLITFDDFRT